jgi:hypothetical protein
VQGPYARAKKRGARVSGFSKTSNQYCAMATSESLAPLLVALAPIHPFLFTRFAALAHTIVHIRVE